MFCKKCLSGKVHFKTRIMYIIIITCFSQYVYVFYLIDLKTKTEKRKQIEADIPLALIGLFHYLYMARKSTYIQNMTIYIMCIATITRNS